MYPVKYRDCFGVHDGKQWIVEPEFRWVGFFHGGFAHAETKTGEECLLDMHGNVRLLRDIANRGGALNSLEFVTPDDSADVPGAHILKAAQDWSVYLLDSRLRLRLIRRLPLDGEVAVYFSGGWLLIRVRDTATPRFIAAKGDQVVELDGFEDTHPPDLNSRYFAVQRGTSPNLWAYYCPEEARLVSEWFHSAHPFSDGLGLVQRKPDGPFVFVDSAMQEMDQLKFKWADVFRFGLAAGLKEDVAGYFDQQGICRIRCDADLGRFNRLGHAIIEHEDGEAPLEVIDRTGQSLIDSLESCTFFDGDFPCYDAWRNGRQLTLTETLEVLSFKSG